MTVSKERKELGMIAAGTLLALILIFLFARIVAGIVISGINLIFG